MKTGSVIFSLLLLVSGCSQSTTPPVPTNDRSRENAFEVRGEGEKVNPKGAKIEIDAPGVKINVDRK